MSIPNLVLIRHGESIWNSENRFTGWVDVDLSERGLAEAKRAGSSLKDQGLVFDIAYTSVLKRAIRTLNIVLDELDQQWLPVHKSWCLNERHYGGLQGLNKKETALKHGDEQVHIWRRSFDIRPPDLDEEEYRKQCEDPRYKSVFGGTNQHQPRSESLKDTIARLIPYWKQEIAPQLQVGRKVLIAAHGNSLRGLIKHLESISDQEIMQLNIPTATPVMYQINEANEPLRLTKL